MLNATRLMTPCRASLCPRRALVSALLLIPLLAAGIATAGPAESQAARRFVEDKQAKIEVALKAGKAGEEQLVGLLDSMLDYEAFATAALGRHADALSSEQRTRFQGVLEELIRASYRRNLRAPEHYVVTFVGEADTGTGGVLVSTVAKHRTKKREEPLQVDYAVQVGSKGLRVRDIVTGGVSLVTNYRRQFGRIIEKKGFDGLMALMEKKLKTP